MKNDNHRETAKLEGLRASFQQSLDELRKEKVLSITAESKVLAYIV